MSGISKSNNTTDDKSEPSRGDHDFWIVKIDSLGNKTWDKTFGGTELDSCRQAIVTADGGYLLVGDTNSSLGSDITQSGQGGRDYWVVKIDALGNKLWDKRFGGSGNDVPNRVITTSDGGILLVGSSSSGTGGDKSEQSRGNTDFWILKISRKESI